MNLQIVELQRQLKAAGFYHGALDGIRGPMTKAAEAARAKAESAKASPLPGPLADRLSVIASAEIGNAESPRGSNRGPEILKYFHADWLESGGKTDGYAWCAAFVCWCVQQAVGGAQVAFAAPRTPGAWDFERWAREQAGKGVELIKPAVAPQRGDIVVFRFSHIGIVVSVDGDSIATVEGNTNPEGGREGYGVFRRFRDISECRSFIRLA